MSQLPNPEDYRRPEFPVHPLFVKRWSPRALSGAPVTEEQLLTIFEAAGYAPSTYNEQEWRFLYARRDTPHWPLLFNLLVEANQAWCQNAAALVVVLARKTFTRNGKPNPVHLFDVGAAFENAALQATSMGLFAHGMAGFDWDRAPIDLKIPEQYAVAAMFAIGHPGDPDQLPEDFREAEHPSTRRPVRESICEGAFAFKE